MPEQRPHRRDLIERKLPVEDVPAVKTILRFQVGRRDRLRGQNQPADTRRESLERAEHVAQQRVFRRPPVGVPETIRRIVRVDRHHVRSRRRQARIEDRRDRGIEPGLIGQLAVLDVIERTLHVVECRADMNAAREGVR